MKKTTKKDKRKEKRNKGEEKEDNISTFYVWNKGARETNIFLDDYDYLRFIYNIFVFQNKNKKHSGNLGCSFLKYVFDSLKEKNQNREINVLKEKQELWFLGCSPYFYSTEKSAKNKWSLSSNFKLITFVLLPHSFHLLIQTSSLEDLTLFLKRVCASYALYFNKRYNKTGAVFEGRYKIIKIKNEEKIKKKKNEKGGEEKINNILLDFIFFLHSLPLEENQIKREYLKESEEKENNSENQVLFIKYNEGFNQDFEFLKTYRWSSHLDYCGWNNFPYVLDKNFIWNSLNGPEKYKKDLILWLSQREKNKEKIKEIIKRWKKR